MTEKLDGLGVYNALHEYAETKGNWSRYDREPGPIGWYAEKGKTGTTADFTFEVVDYYSDGSGSYDEHYQGWVGKCYIVFKIVATSPSVDGAPLFFRFEGVVDSYDGEHWDGKFLPVSPKVNNITVYTWE